MAEKSQNSDSFAPASSRPPVWVCVRYAVYGVLALLATLALVSYSSLDDGSLAGGVDAPPENWIGVSGAWFAGTVFSLIGLGGYVLMALVWLRILRGFLPGEHPKRKWWGWGTLLAVFGAALVLGMAPSSFVDCTDAIGIGRCGVPEQAMPGGVIGQFLGAPAVGNPELDEGVMRKFLGVIGTIIVGWALIAAGAVMIFLGDWYKLFLQAGARVLAGAAAVQAAPRRHPIPDNDDEADDTEIPVCGRSVPRKAVLPDTDADDEDDDANSTGAEPPGATGGNLTNRLRGAFSALQSLRGGGGGTGAEPEAEATADSVADPALSADGESPDELNFSAEPKRPVPGSGRRSGESLSAPAPNTRVTERGEAAVPGAAAYTLPLVSMLSKGTEASGEDMDSIVKRREILQRTLDSFHIDGQVTNHISGPRITRYEIQLSPGVKTSKVEAISDNIAMDLEAKSIRVLAPIPGRNAVGVEAPNNRAEAVFLRSVMESDAWTRSKAEIPVVLGKNVAGEPIVLDLAKAPHLLIAGSTGSGKSVCMNTLIMSLLFKFPPDSLQLIMVDPKVVEFAGYQSLPHLITPVVNDSKKVPIALRWAVNEMEKRYRILARVRVKKLREYNELPPRPEPLLDDDGLPLPNRLPVLIVIVDELADLMMTDARKDAETSIARIAQKGRAAGVHIVIATQRPSRDIITGVIKANLPTKIAFMVGSQIDSRVILDQNGAETLLGMGDMLFLPPGTPTLERIQGAFVNDADIAKVVDFVSAQAPQKFDSRVVAEESSEDGEGEGFVGNPRDGEYEDEEGEMSPDIEPVIRKYLRPGDGDLMRKALEIVLLEHKASTSYLQRRLTIGYNRAAELIDQMEERGIVGPPGPGGSKREILVFDEIEG